jgi:hypothetical protein
MMTMPISNLYVDLEGWSLHVQVIGKSDISQR